MTPLHMAAQAGQSAEVRRLLGGGADANARTSPNGFTPLHMCVSGATADTVERQAIIDLLTDAGAELEATTYDKGLTPLQLAVMRNKPLCVAALLRRGANVHATEGNGATALHGAAFYGHMEIARILMAAGARSDQADRLGNTPLSLARTKGHADVLELLENPDKSGRDQEPQTAACSTKGSRRLRELSLEPNCQYEGQGRMELFGGMTITFDLRFRSDASRGVVDYSDTTPGDPMPDEVDIVSLRNTTTGKVVV